ncbi:MULTISPECIES: hypothetical protein [unclassified Allomuricauda]|jgi:hypothetical protein|uniref:hypothetical protein n=1 Tax=unclassified Allomuricauda TaxID=2615049 RepID=UPI00055F3009|nr:MULTISPECIES: hypothetical protein [unclassified Allomuricauda]
MEVTEIDKDFCLSISIFYSQDSWHKLISKGLIPFYDKQLGPNNYFYLLNKNRGDHIALFLIIQRSKTIEVVKDCDNHFKKFLSSNPSSINSVFQTGSKIFCDFENNTVHYGLYNGEIYAKHIAVYKRISKILSFSFEEYADMTIEYLPEIVLDLLIKLYVFSEKDKDEVLNNFKKTLAREFGKLENRNLSVVKKHLHKFYLANRNTVASLIDKERKTTNLKRTQKYLVDILELRKEMNVDTGFILNSLCDFFGLENIEKMSLFYLISNCVISKEKFDSKHNA